MRQGVDVIAVPTLCAAAVAGVFGRKLRAIVRVPGGACVRYPVSWRQLLHYHSRRGDGARG